MPSARQVRHVPAPAVCCAKCSSIHSAAWPPATTKGGCSKNAASKGWKWRVSPLPSHARSTFGTGEPLKAGPASPDPHPISRWAQQAVLTAWPSPPPPLQEADSTPSTQASLAERGEGTQQILPATHRCCAAASRNEPTLLASSAHRATVCVASLVPTR